MAIAIRASFEGAAAHRDLLGKVARLEGGRSTPGRADSLAPGAGATFWRRGLRVNR